MVLLRTDFLFIDLCVYVLSDSTSTGTREMALLVN